MNKVTAMPNKEQQEFDAAMEAAQRSLDRFGQVMDVVARQRKMAYDAHRQAGFSHEDAIELCKSA